MQLFRCQRFAGSALCGNHFSCGIGRIAASGLTFGQPAGNDFVRSLAVQNQQRNAAGLGHFGGELALFLFQIGSINHHGETGLQRSQCALMQVFVDGSGDVGTIDAFIQRIAVKLLLAKQALALYI